mmetsp:Transcript_8179/g.18388  ORF Transcript_8179/g.18388 Transcript_8179/m.18388 type:complete len:203 (+) Transcript_8179:526-1134(+)
MPGVGPSHRPTLTAIVKVVEEDGRPIGIGGGSRSRTFGGIGRRPDQLLIEVAARAVGAVVLDLFEGAKPGTDLVACREGIRVRSPRAVGRTLGPGAVEAGDVPLQEGPARWQSIGRRFSVGTATDRVGVGIQRKRNLSYDRLGTAIDSATIDVVTRLGGNGGKDQRRHGGREEEEKGMAAEGEGAGTGTGWGWNSVELHRRA